MEAFTLPVGKITYFEGNILRYKPNLIGFFYVKVKAPLNLEHPILQIHKDNMTIAPVGSFNMVIYSSEMYNAMRYGYTFDIINGYYFEKEENIFKEYIKKLYNLRLK